MTSWLGCPESICFWIFFYDGIIALPLKDFPFTERRRLALYAARPRFFTWMPPGDCLAVDVVTALAYFRRR